MDIINVLVTGAGSPGIAGTIYSLKNNYDNRKINIVVTDSQEDVIGKYLADKFYQIPAARFSTDYLNEIYRICTVENIQVILPQNTAELSILSQSKDIFESVGVNISISSHLSIQKANNKYELLKICEKCKIPHPSFYLVSNINELNNAMVSLGWPEKPDVVKPPNSNGSRGIRIINEKINYKELYYNEKPTNVYIKSKNFMEIIGNEFEPLLVMEYLPGYEITVDVFRTEKTQIILPRKRDAINCGISFRNSVFDDARVLSYTEILSNSLDLKFCFGFQYKLNEYDEPKILECNPRIQGTMIFSTFMGANIIYSAVKASLMENIPNFNIDINTKLLRYWGAVGISSDNIIKI